MKKISFVLALILALSAVLASCGGRTYNAFTIDPDYVPENTGSSSYVQDFEGNRINIPKTIEKIVCFSPEAAIIIRGIGSQKLIKAIDEETKNATVIDNVITVDQINGQNPDIVFIKDSYDTTAIDSSIACIRIPETMTVNDAKTLIKIIEKALNSKKDSYADEIDKQINLAQSATNEYVSKFATFVDLGDLMTAGSGTYVNEIVSISGGANVFADREGYFTVTKEEIVAANPTFIITTTNAATYTRDAELKVLDCVKANRIIKVEPSKIKYASQNIADVIPTIFEAINNYKISVTQ